MHNIRVAINGYGRIGKTILRAFYENYASSSIQIVAINDLGHIDINIHLTKYDTTHGQFPHAIERKKNIMVIDQKDEIHMLSEPTVEKLPWKQLDIDIVYECTGYFTHREAATRHLQAGAKKVLISAPAQEVDKTVIYGINHSDLYKENYQIISNGSCTTNCLAMLIKPLHEQLEIQQGLMTTVHAYTNDQVLLDNYHPDVYRARAATQSMIPTKTGAASMINVIFPELAGKLDGVALRVPISNVSLLDLTFKTRKIVNVDKVNQILQQASNNELKGLLDYNKEPLVSSDFNHHTASAIVASQQTIVINGLIKVFAWYDNEWGFSNRMLDITIAWYNF